MKFSIVIGASFGDEGKGKTTAFLSSLNPEKTLVFRFSGGQQAGHTVEEKNIHHVFSSFGSGTIQNVPTIWSKYCSFYPISFINELNALKNLNINPTIYIDPLCPITTPYDIIANRLDPKSKIIKTVGVGIEKTFKRHESPYKLYFEDLFYNEIFNFKYNNIAFEYYNNLKIPSELEISYFKSIKTIQNCKNIKKYDESIIDRNIEHIIFEGSQGILLDQNFGFFPYVTKSNTTAQNALEIINSLEPNANVNIYYVTRTYQHRHGSGYMSNESEINLINNENETNIYNEYQGNFRKGHFDPNLLNYAINYNEIIMKNFKNSYKRNLVITCCDQLFTDEIKNNLKMVLNKWNFNKIYKSFGPETKNIYQV